MHMPTTQTITRMKPINVAESLRCCQTPYLPYMPYKGYNWAEVGVIIPFYWYLSKFYNTNLFGKKKPQ